MSTTNKTNGSEWFLSALFLIFLTLKLCGVINWSWWWVTAPLWGGLAIGLLALGVLLFISKK